MSEHPHERDRRMVRRAAVAVAVQTAAAVAVVVLVMASVVLVIDRHQRAAHAEEATRTAWATADDVDDPPPDTWLVVVTPSGRRQVSPRAPRAVRQIDPTTLPDGARHLTGDEHELVVWTGTRKDLGRVSAVYDRHADLEGQQRLLATLGLAALVGVLGAAAVGAMVGRRAVRPLAEALGLQRRFVADASHELRTPLTVLSTRAQMLRRRLGREVPAARLDALDDLVSDTRRLSEVIEDLLLSAQLEHEGRAGEAVDLAELARDVSHQLQPLAEQRGVQLTSAADGDEDGHLVVRGAATALRRALTALVDNAIAHTCAGGHVEVTVSTDGEQVRVAVRDDGEGLDPELASTLVARFARGTSDDSGRRFGLGLALVDEVARAHGGRLEISGRPGHGACLALHLPRLR